MNFTSIAISSGHDRDLVESLIREILQALSRVIAYRDPVEFPFYNIGYLVVRDFKARCKFNPGFIKKMDGTGELSKILESKKNKKKQLQRAKTTLDDPNDSFELVKLPEIGDHKVEAKVGDIPTAGLCGFESIKNETVAKKSQTRVMSPPEKKQRPQNTVLPEVLENLNYW